MAKGKISVLFTIEILVIPCQEYNITNNCKVLKCTFVCTGIGIIDMKIFFENCFWITLPSNKSDKNGILDVVASYLEFGK